MREIMTINELRNKLTGFVTADVVIVDKEENEYQITDCYESNSKIFVIKIEKI